MRKGLKKGFTLIELLVVIAIIAILATVVIINVTGARAKSARAKVAADYNTASKIAAACTSFGGSLTPAATAASGGTICTAASLALITDTVESATATGNYPATVANFTPSWTGTTATALTVIVTASGGAGSGTFTCTLAGCTAASGW